MSSNALASTADVGSNRYYTFTSTVPLTAAATNGPWYVIGRTTAGDAVISNPIPAIVNP